MLTEREEISRKDNIINKISINGQTITLVIQTPTTLSLISFAWQTLTDQDKYVTL